MLYYCELFIHVDYAILGTLMDVVYIQIDFTLDFTYVWTSLMAAKFVLALLVNCHPRSGI